MADETQDPKWFSKALVQIGHKGFSARDFFDTEIEPISWAVGGGLVMESGFTTISGEGGIGKSYVLIALSISLATGVPVFGYFDVTRPYRVLYIDMEMPARATKLRFQRMTRGMFREFPEMLESNLMVVGQGTFSVDAVGSVAALQAFIEAMQVDFVLIDSFRQIFGGDEKDSQYTVRAFQTLAQIRNKTSCGFIFIDHWRKTQADAGMNNPKDRLTGSANKRNNLDTHITIEPTGKKDWIRVRPEKDRHGDQASTADPFEVHFNHDNREDETGPFRLLYVPAVSKEDEVTVLEYLKSRPEGCASMKQIQLDTRLPVKSVQRATTGLVRAKLLKKQFLGRVMMAYLQLDKGQVEVDSLSR